SYSNTVHFTSSDTAASLPANVTLTSGSGTFSATLKTPGSQTFTATDTAWGVTGWVVQPGTSTAITVQGLMVTSFTPTSIGFTATFNQPFNASQLNLY